MVCTQRQKPGIGVVVSRGAGAVRGGGEGVTKVSVKPGLSVVQQNVKDGDEWLRGQVHT